MNNEKLKKEIDDIQSDLKIFDFMAKIDWSDKENTKHYITENQANAIEKVLKLLKNLNWELHLANTKDIKSESRPTLNLDFFPVKIMPCGKEYEGKTFFGLHLGRLSTAIHFSVDKTDPEYLVFEPSHYNPAIYVPELNKLIMGYESFWGEISSEDELKELITEETIKNIWYMKLLKEYMTK